MEQTDPSSPSGTLAALVVVGAIAGVSLLCAVAGFWFLCRHNRFRVYKHRSIVDGLRAAGINGRDAQRCASLAACGIKYKVYSVKYKVRPRVAGPRFDYP